MIRGTCPDCGTVRPLPDYLTDAETRAALAAALDCPAGLARRIVPYLALHSPAARCIQAGRLTRLLRELADLLASGEVTRAGTTHACPQAVWEAAFDQVAAAHQAGTLTLPLDGHGYLLAIAHAKAARAVGGGPGAVVADRPIHPSQAPAPTAAVAPVADWGQRRAAGLDHIAGLSKMVRRPPDTEETP